MVYRAKLWHVPRACFLQCGPYLNCRSPSSPLPPGLYMYGSLDTLLAPANTRRAPLWAHVRQQLEAQGAVGPELEVRGLGTGAVG